MTEGEPNTLFSDDERESAWDSTGTRKPFDASAYSPAIRGAIYDQHGGDPAMRREVARERRKAADAAQQVINRAGADGIRSEDIERDRAKGIDVDSSDYQAKLRLKELGRHS